MLSACEDIVREYEAAKRENPKTAIIICGPTASGKTGLSLEVAKRLGGEIVSCDSMQIYRYMDIGTAKATEEEQAVAPHHMIDIIEPWEGYNAYLYKAAAEACINDILSRGKVPVITGGTGLYVNSLIDNRQYTNPDGVGDIYDRAGLESLKRLAEIDAFEEIHNTLKIHDSEAAEKVHAHNRKRVIKALELYYITGKTQSVRNGESVITPPEINYKIYCLAPDRAELYDKINRRVDIMLQNGLLKEVRTVYNMCVEALGSPSAAEGITSLQAIGYKEYLPFVKNYGNDEDILNSEGFAAATDIVKQNSRRYAKRQLTWFRKTAGAKFIN